MSIAKSMSTDLTEDFKNHILNNQTVNAVLKFNNLERSEKMLKVTTEEFCRTKINELINTAEFDNPETKKIFELMIKMILIPVIVLSPMISELKKEISELKNSKVKPK